MSRFVLLGVGLAGLLDAVVSSEWTSSECNKTEDGPVHAVHGLIPYVHGSREDGSAEPDFEKQVQLAFDNLTRVLTAAGWTLADIVDVTTFHTDPQKQFETVLAIKDKVFAAPPFPSWTAVGVTWLAGFDFEIKVIARVPGTA